MSLRYASNASNSAHPVWLLPLLGGDHYVVAGLADLSPPANEQWARVAAAIAFFVQGLRTDSTRNPTRNPNQNSHHNHNHTLKYNHTRNC